MWMALPHAYAGRRARWPCERMRQPGPRRPRRRLKLGNSCWFRGLLGHSEAPRRRGCRHVASPRRGGHSRTRQDIARTPPCAWPPPGREVSLLALRIGVSVEGPGHGLELAIPAGRPKRSSLCRATEAPGMTRLWRWASSLDSFRRRRRPACSKPRRLHRADRAR